MREFTLMTDVNTDVEEDYAAAEGIVIMPQYYHFGDGVIYGDEIKLDPETFYKRLDAGEVAKSSGCNPARVKEMFEIELNKGKDILAIICSSGLSMSYNTCLNVGKELMEERPECKIIVIDSLNESEGAGLMLHMARDMQLEGHTMEEIEAEVIKQRENFHAMFIVDDLKYLVRGGRLSAFKGAVGTMLDIKPILYINTSTEGKIVPLKKVRTRKRAIEEILRMFNDMDPDPRYTCVVYTANEQSARELMVKVKEELGLEVKFINEINNTIGAHTGPNALGFGCLARKPLKK
ncbi:MAG: DegV family protein [Eubacterium sp.]|nr:DegV family protein [Eubacterium sp.]